MLDTQWWTTCTLYWQKKKVPLWTCELIAGRASQKSNTCCCLEVIPLSLLSQCLMQHCFHGYSTKLELPLVVRPTISKWIFQGMSTALTQVLFFVLGSGLETHWILLTRSVITPPPQWGFVTLQKRIRKFKKNKTKHFFCRILSLYFKIKPVFLILQDSLVWIEQVKLKLRL